jgi:putative ABC transport system permease protein
MSVREALVVAIRGVRANRLRSLLTMLGIMIGVAAVILLVALGNGTSARLNEQIESLGTNLISVAQSRGSVSEGGRVEPLTDRDVEALRNATTAPRIVTVTPVKQASAVLKSAHSMWRTGILGSSQDYPGAFNRTLQAGTFFTESQVRTGARVVVLGPRPAAKLFGSPAAALGQQLRVGAQLFEVVGVLKANGQSDNLAVMPITTVRTYLIGGGADDEVDQIIVQATGRDAVSATMDKVTGVLMQTHHISNPEHKDFEVRSNLDLLERYTGVTGVFTFFLATVAAISLLVGGIGVMNIMLVTVTERTREIGIRKAVGARRKAILKQFLVESTVLSGIGGLIGVVVGVGLALLGEQLGASASGFAPPRLSIGSVIIAFTVSLCIGLFFGAYPANRAAQLRPIEALRYE